MRVITRAVFQMTDDPEEFILLEEDSHEYEGEVALAGGTVGDNPKFGPAIDFYNAQAKLLKQYGLDSLDWASEQWKDMPTLLDRILGTQKGIADTRLGSAQDWQQRYEESFVPLEQQLVQDAISYNSPGRQEYEAGRAIADVGQAFDAQRRSAEQRLINYGISPDQTRAQALDANVRTQEAIAKANAANQARRQVEETGRAIRSQGINLGQGNVNNAVRGYADAYRYGTGQLENQRAGLSGQQAIYQAGILPWISAESGAYGQGVNLLQQNFANKVQQQQLKNESGNGIIPALGTAAGMAAGAFLGGPGGAALGASLGNTFSNAGSGGGSVSSGIPITGADLASGMTNLNYNNYAEGGPVKAGGAPMEIDMEKGDGGDYTQVMGWKDIGTQDGQVEGPGGPKDDLIDAKLSDGEYVIPAEVVSRKGTEFFDKLVENTRKAIPEEVPAGAAMVAMPPGGPPMGGATGAIPMMAQGGCIRKRS